MAPVGEAGSPESCAGLGPLRAQRRQGGQESDHHKGYLKVDVGKDEAGHLIEPHAIRKNVDPEAVTQDDRDEPLHTDRRDEGKGKHHTAELGKHARRRLDDGAQQPTDLGAEHRIANEGTNDGTDHSGDSREPKRAAKSGEDGRGEQPRDVLERQRTVVREEARDDGKHRRQGEEDENVDRKRR